MARRPRRSFWWLLGTRESRDISQIPQGAWVEVTQVSLELSGNEKI